jgi:hypothetical protein
MSHLMDLQAGSAPIAALKSPNEDEYYKILQTA